MSSPHSYLHWPLVLVFGVSLGQMALAAPVDGKKPLCQIPLVLVDGRRFSGFSADGIPVTTLKLPPRPGRVDFNFAPVDAAKQRPLRLRYKLDGFDQEWREAGGEMKLLVITQDASNHVFSYNEIPFLGESQGWHGSLDRSDFESRQASVELPEGTEKLQVLLISEDLSILGVVAISRFRVLRTNSAGRVENVWPDSNLEEGEHLDRPDGQPRYWQRGNFGAHMAHVYQLPPPATGHALVIVDDDIHGSASWQSAVPLKQAVRASETVTLEWQETFSVGISGHHHHPYYQLSSGAYHFRVKALTPMGEPVGAEVAMAVSIPPVFWRRPLVLALVLLVSTGSAAGIVRLQTQRRLRSALAHLEQQRTLYRERTRIAQDIHDDLGASLTRINLLSQSALGKIETSHPAWLDAKNIRSEAVNVTQSLDEVVWAVSPRHDTLESLLNYLTDFAAEFLELAGIRARVHVAQPLPEWVLPAELRHNLFLAVKETLNNVVKHAHATEIHFRLEPQADAFLLRIEDNGCGFDQAATADAQSECPTHHGLASVKKRIESLGGHFALESAPRCGTRVSFTVPVPQVESYD